MTLEEILARIEASSLEDKKPFVEMIENIYKKGQNATWKLYEHYEDIITLPWSILNTSNIRKNEIFVIPGVSSLEDFNNTAAELHDLLLTDRYLMWKGVYLFEIETPLGHLPFFASVIGLSSFMVSENISDDHFKNLKVMFYNSIRSFLRETRAEQHRRQYLSRAVTADDISNLI